MVKQTAWILYITVFVWGVMAASRGAAAAADRQHLHASRRQLLQARPMSMAMNPPIFLSEDSIERGPAQQVRLPPNRPQPGNAGAGVRNNRGLLQDNNNKGRPDFAAATRGPNGIGGSNPAAFQRTAGNNANPAGTNRWNAQPIRGANSNWGQPAANQGRPAGGNPWGGNQGRAVGGNGSGSKQWGATGSNNLRGNRQSLNALTGSFSGYQGITPQPIAISGPASTLAQGIRRRGNARAAAQSLAQAYSSGQADAAANAIAASATDTTPGFDSAAVAETVAEATVVAPNIAPNLLGKSAATAVSKGQTKRFAQTMANAFTVAKQKSYMPQFTTALAESMSTGGAPAKYAFGQAMATAIAQGADGQAAVAQATAEAFCQGGSTASSWAQAYAIALAQDSNGCLVLNQAKALAQARCGNGAAEAFSKAEATSTVLGFCGLLDLVPGGVNMGWSGSSGSSNTASNGATYGGLLDPSSGGFGGK